MNELNRQSVNQELKNVISDIEKHTQSCIKRFLTIQEKEMEVLSSLNNGIVPHRDPKGRLHAASDGYQDVTGKVYLRGQYIPGDYDSEDAFYSAPIPSPKIRTRIRVMDEIIEGIKETFDDFKSIDEETEKVTYHLDGVKFSFGKEWENKNPDNPNGKVNAFLYINAFSKGYLNIIAGSIRELVSYQLEQIEKAIQEKKDEAKKLKGDAPEGKVFIEGKILGLPVHENYYGYQEKVMIELDNGSTVFGSLPAKLSGVEIGDRVTFKANFTVAEGDKTHAFFKRPTQPKVL